MKITKLEVFVLGDSRSLAPNDISYIEELPFLRIKTDEGITGLSEMFGVPAGVARAVVDGTDSLFRHLLVGEDPIPPERLWHKLYNSLMHSNRRGWVIRCLGAVDVALWDIFGKALDRPVYQLLGGAERCEYQIDSDQQRREVVPYCTVVSSTNERPTILHEQVERSVALQALGYRAVKVEPMNSTPETVIELARLAREALGPEMILCLDVGYLWNDVGVAIRVSEALAEYDIFFFETPFPVDSMEPYARLAAHTPIRIAAGEHAVTRWEFLDFMDRGKMQVVQPYMTTCGGLTEAKRIVELALARGVLVCPGNWSTHALGSATVQLAAYSPITPIFESVHPDPRSSPLRKAIYELGLPIVRGAVALPDRPGIGFELPDDVIEHFSVG
jgi:L-alanine-DL-glutamate epimerase-like enolase superfamily enzyme